MLKRMFRLHIKEQECLEGLRAAAVDCLEELRQSAIDRGQLKNKLVELIRAKAEAPIGHTVARRILRLRVRIGGEMLKDDLEWAEQIIENIEHEIAAIENRQMVTMASIAALLSVVAVRISVASLAIQVASSLHCR